MTMFILIKTVYLMGGFYENVQTKTKKYSKTKKVYKWQQVGER
jgi:hypothetical protein